MNSMEIYPILDEEIEKSNKTQECIDSRSWEDYADA
jgi:hypothetical protein